MEHLSYLILTLINHYCKNSPLIKTKKKFNRLRAEKNHKILKEDD